MKSSSKHFTNITRISLVLLLVMVAITSCKKFVEIPPPAYSLTTGNVFNKNTTATAAQLSIYAQMQSYSSNMLIYTGLSADEFKNYSTNATTKDIYANALNASLDATKLLIWTPSYSYIYQSNAVIEGVAASPGVTSSVKKQLTGESEFLRAYFHFYLTQLYGDVPLILSTDYTLNAKATKTAKNLVMQQVIADLKDAQSLLNPNYVDVSDTIATTSRIRPNKWAATALLARAYLYDQQWVNAETQASAIIANTSVYSLPSDLNAVFLMNSSEAIWQLQPSSKNNYTPEGSNLIIKSNPVTNPVTYVSSISDPLMNSFEAGDTRKIKWISSYTSTSAPIATYNFDSKYKASSTATSLTEYSMILRLAEQYLIRAEARAQQGTNLAGAIADLNIIRNRAGLPLLASSLNQAAVLTAVAQERRVELFGEGHRWLDLKRTNTIDAVMTTAAPQKGGTWSTYKQLYPIPLADLTNSGGAITQNNGY